MPVGERVRNCIPFAKMSLPNLKASEIAQWLLRRLNSLAVY